MAEKLTNGHGSNGPEPLSRAVFIGFVDRHAEIEDELTEAQETVRSVRRRRKDLRKTITASGINIDEFDRHLRDVNRSGEEREAADQQYRKYMAWRLKPVGFQQSMDLDADSAVDIAAMKVHELKRVDQDGFAAGKRGDRADSNSWTPGTEEHQRWHSAWLRGQEEKVVTEIKPPEAMDGRKGRVMTEDQKAAMKAGRDRARAAKEAAAQA